MKYTYETVIELHENVTIYNCIKLIVKKESS